MGKTWRMAQNNLGALPSVSSLQKVEEAVVLNREEGAVSSGSKFQKKQGLKIFMFHHSDILIPCPRMSFFLNENLASFGNLTFCIDMIYFY